MLIYSGGDVSPFGPVRYKSTRSRSRKTTRTKTSKRVGRRGNNKKKRRVNKKKKKKVKKTRRKVKRRRKGGKKKLSAKNIKFFKQLGLRVKK